MTENFGARKLTDSNFILNACRVDINWDKIRGGTSTVQLHAVEL
jgi:hypothetical protein